MRGRRGVQRPGVLIGIGLTLIGGPLEAATQSDSVYLSDSAFVARATLAGWDEGHRLTIFDRGGSFFGRLSERGILQRFADDVDDEYDLDFISSEFDLIENYRWYNQENGARYWTGSIDNKQLVQQAQLVASIWLGESWGGLVQFNHQRTLQARMSLIQLQIRRKLFSGRALTFLMSTLNAEKSEIDLELGFVWLPTPGKITLAVGALDVFNDLIFQGLVPNPFIADSSLDYTSHPFTGRIALDVPLGRRFRAEGYALVMSPTRIVLESRANPDSGFVQDESYAYAGGLLEWDPSTRSALGSFATWVRARLDRAALPDGSPDDNFDLTEKTWSLGLYGIHRFAPRFDTQIWFGRVFREELRLTPDPAPEANLDYEDRAWAGRSNFTYRALSGLRLELGLDLVARNVVGPDPRAGSRFLENDNFRLRFDFGWTFGRRAFFVIGANLDLDGDRASSGGFDGAHGRFALYW